jgi:heme/copper-type cytochrome/quinol oxidase subunit 3
VTTETGSIHEGLIDRVEAELELRCAEGALWTGTRLLIGIVTFVWAGVAFAFFYLREVDTAQAWRPAGVRAPVLIGTLVLFAVLATALLNAYGVRRMRRGGRLEWLVAGWVGVGFGVLAVGLQVWELTRLGFQPGDSGYTSVFIGWAGLNIAFLIGGTYWLETLLAQSLRHGAARLSLDAAASTAGETEGGSVTSRRLHRSSLDGCTYFWGYTALVSAGFWVMFYIL